MMFEFWHAHVAFVLLANVAIPGSSLKLGVQMTRLIGLLGISFIQMADLSVAAYVDSFTGGLSVTSLAVLSTVALLRMGMPVRPTNIARVQIIGALALLALFLYPATLGLSHFDPYQLGFHPRLLILTIGLTSLLFLAWRNYCGAGLLGLVTLAFCLAIKPSHNYWDYLLDPFISLYCIGTLLCYAVKTLWNRLTPHNP
jgi:hypothetical protein